jgi:hypothetical protein
MTCQDVKDVVKKYGTITDLVKTICSDRACTLDAIQKGLRDRDIEITDVALVAIISKIKEIVIFDKIPSYDIGDVVTYRRYWLGIVDMGETIGNMIICVEYKNFILYNVERYTDDAFRKHIISKLEFEELRRFVVSDTDGKGGLSEALKGLKIEKDKWKNYVLVDDGRVYCMKRNKQLGYSYKKYLGKLISRTPSK